MFNILNEYSVRKEEKLTAAKLTGDTKAKNIVQKSEMLFCKKDSNQVNLKSVLWRGERRDLNMSERKMISKEK